MNNGNKVVIVLGPPGSGKGTQGRIVQQEKQCEYIATGDLVREMRSRAGNGDGFYDEIKDRYDKGIPQPDDIINQAMDRKLSEIDLSKGLVLDSYPLSLGQVEGMRQLLEKYQLGEPKVLYIDVDGDEVVERLSKRRFCPKCSRPFLPGTDAYEKNVCDTCQVELQTRADDKEEVVRKRYDEYIERLNPIIDFYEEKKWIEKIDGKGTVEEITQRIEEVL